MMALAVVGFGVGVLVLMVVCDLLPHRAFYSRRAFEPPPRTWAEEQDDLERVDWQPWGPTELYRPDPRPIRRGLPASAGRELEWYDR